MPNGTPDANLQKLLDDLAKQLGQRKKRNFVPEGVDPGARPTANIDFHGEDIGHALTKWARLWHYCYSRMAQML
jgi:hypothetical protein